MHLKQIKKSDWPEEYQEILRKIDEINRAGIKITGGDFLDPLYGNLDCYRLLGIEIPEMEGYYTALWYTPFQIVFQLFVKAD